MRKIRHIIVHHSLSPWGDGEVIKSWHCSPKPQGNGWDNPGYHVVICNAYPNYSSWSSRRRLPPPTTADGRVDRILPEDRISNGCKYANADALQVCLIGDLDKQPPTGKQREALINLLALWCKGYGLDPYKAVFGHGEMQQKIGREKYIKTCPGKTVDMENIRGCVAATLKESVTSY